jgi:zinc protease
MKNTLKYFFIIAGMLPVSSFLIYPQINIKYEKYILPNGLQVILHEDHSVPLVTTNIWYHTGASREKPGKTGFAHLFEHLMYEGSEHVRDGLYDEIVEGSGGTNNGSTGGDRTNYWTIIPKNYLEQTLWLESDRMGYLLGAITQERLDVQRDVVKNERRENYENRPYGLAPAKIMEALYPEGVPYHWLGIGSQEDLSAASLDDVKGFFRTYYGPNNASLCIGGDIDIVESKKLVEKYFGNIPAAPEVVKPKPNNVKLDSLKRLVIEDQVELPRLYLYWLSPTIYSKDDAEIDILAQILSDGKNSRLFKSLVYDNKVAQEVFAFQNGMELNGYFAIVVTGKQDQQLKIIEQEIYSEIEKIVKSGVTKRELDKVKNGIKANFIYSLQSIGGFGSKTDQLNNYNVYLGDPGKFNFDLGRYQKVTSSDIKNVARKYLRNQPHIVLSVVPKGKIGLQAGGK